MQQANGWLDGIIMLYHSPYLWGKTAVDQFKERQKKGWVLCKQPGMAEVLDMLDKNIIKQSTSNFPIDISLEVRTYDYLIIRNVFDMLPFIASKLFVQH